MSITPYPKPARRIIDPWAARTKKGPHSIITCRCCGVAYRRTRLHMHHLVPRSRSGDDVPDNLVPLCAGPGTKDCHGLFESHPKTRLFGHLIISNLTPNELAYCRLKMGQGFLDRYYPARHRLTQGEWAWLDAWLAREPGRWGQFEPSPPTAPAADP